MKFFAKQKEGVRGYSWKILAIPKKSMSRRRAERALPAEKYLGYFVQFSPEVKKKGKKKVAVAVGISTAKYAKIKLVSIKKIVKKMFLSFSDGNSISELHFMFFYMAFI